MFLSLLRLLKLLPTPSVDGTVKAFSKAIAKLEQVAEHHDANEQMQTAKAQAAMLKAKASATEAKYARNVRAKLHNLFSDDEATKVVGKTEPDSQ